MPKNIHTPRDELICGAIDDAEDLARDLESVALMDVLARIRHMASRMEAKLVSRKDDAARLKAELRQREWQPIGTAPKDGSEINLGMTLTWGIDAQENDESRIGNGFYAAGAFFWSASEGRWRNRIGHYIFSATHWMPLPAAHAGGEEEAHVPKS